MTTPQFAAHAMTQLRNQGSRFSKLILTQPVAASEADTESDIRRAACKPRANCFKIKEMSPQRAFWLVARPELFEGQNDLGR